VEGRDAARFGDEPVVMAEALSGTAIVVGRKRFESAMWFLAINDCDLFLLDDGFQHLQLARDCDVVVLSSSARWHREGASALRDADVLIRRTDADRNIASANPKIPTFEAALRPRHVRRGAAIEPLETLSSRRVIAFSGLADNSQFFSSLRRLGADVAAERSFPDHHPYSPEDVRLLRELATRHGAELITTAKDAVKLPFDVSVLDVEMHVENEEALVKLVLEKCRLTK
jgi:tetraacyldisaccharide 4'-kinase